MATLFTSPASDDARACFAAKPRGLVDKVMSVAEAVSRLIHDGDYLATGGFGTNRLPTAVCHEILRQKKQNLGFSGHTATHDFQILAAGNMTGRGQLLARVDVAYFIGLEARGLSPHARRVMESGDSLLVHGRRTMGGDDRRQYVPTLGCADATAALPSDKP